MKPINELTNALKKHLSWNQARISCLAQLIQAIFMVRTVNLAEIATAFKRNAKTESSYRRIQRFLKDFHFDLTWIVPIIDHFFDLKEKLTLIMDRTNWQFGKAKINILVLAIAYRGIAIPIFWMVLNTKGNSASKHRKELMNQAIKTFGKERIEIILADREFVGSDWFEFLIEENLPFCIRIQRKYMIKGARNGYMVPVRMLFKNLKPYKRKILKEPYSLWGIPVYLSGGRVDHGDILITASSVSLKDPIETYKIRWEIETLFGCLKKRGFRMEETHLTKTERIEKLFFILVIAFCWAYKLGNIKNLSSPVKVKNHGRSLFSLFRYGFDEIRKILLTSDGDWTELESIIKVFISKGTFYYA